MGDRRVVYLKRKLILWEVVPVVGGRNVRSIGGFIGYAEAKLPLSDVGSELELVLLRSSYQRSAEDAEEEAASLLLNYIKHVMKVDINDSNYFSCQRRDRDLDASKRKVKQITDQCEILKGLNGRIRAGFERSLNCLCFMHMECDRINQVGSASGETNGVDGMQHEIMQLKDFATSEINSAAATLAETTTKSVPSKCEELLSDDVDADSEIWQIHSDVD